MRKILVAAALTASTALAAPAFAQSTAPFTGPRIEGVVGYESVGVEDIDDNSEGVTYGLGIGYDFQMGNMVAGIEAEATDSDNDQCRRDIVAPGDRLCAGVGRDLYVGGRIGTVVGSNTLLYAKAGYTNGRLRTEYTNPAGAETTEGENLDGVRLGAGAEFAIGPNSFAKAEYRYSNYEQDFEKHQVMAGFGFRF